MLSSKKQRLEALLEKTKILKKDHTSVSSELAKFTFSSLLPQRGISDKKGSLEKRKKKSVEKDKENQKNRINETDLELKERKKKEIDPLGLLNKKENILQKAIISQLNEIKNLEKKENSMRKTN